MSQSQQANNSSLSQESSVKKQLITSFVELKQLLTEDPVFSDYTLKEPNSSCLTLYADGQTKVIIDKAIWNDPELKAEYFAYAHTAGTILILAGDEDELKSFELAENELHIQFLYLPQTKQGIASLVRSLHNLQTAIETVQLEREQVEASTEEIKYMLRISRELNGERNIDKLLGLILAKAREVTNADAGSIYTLERLSNDIHDAVLKFRFTQNDSIEQNLSTFTLKVSEESIVGKAVLSKQPINIPDLYQLTDDPKTNPWGAKHDKSWDLRTGYESHSMLTLPIYDISHNVVGVIQLINRKKEREKPLVSTNDFFDQVIPFDEMDVEYALIVSQQAGIALENANLNKEIQNLFDGFVDAAVTAIEQRDPTTSGHSHRVAQLTTEMARIVHDLSFGPFSSVRFSEDEFREIKYASLLHDFGKVGVREKLLVKSKKLYEWELDIIHQRFDLIRSRIEITALQKKVDFLQHPDRFPMDYTLEHIEQERITNLLDLENLMKFIENANEPTVLEQESFDKLRDIANLSYMDIRGNYKPYLMSDELKALSVSRGSLTREEFAEIQSHVTHTYEFLRKIPWGRKLANVPHIAAKHHEKLDGSGYPTGAASSEIPVQTRMMTISDIFDALTASDRPYKKAVPVERALDILSLDVKAKKIDSRLFEIFLDTKVYMKIIDSNNS